MINNIINIFLFIILIFYYINNNYDNFTNLKNIKTLNSKKNSNQIPILKPVLNEIPMLSEFIINKPELDIYNYHVLDDFKDMFLQPSHWLGHSDFDGNEKVQKIFINNYENLLYKKID